MCSPAVECILPDQVVEASYPSYLFFVRSHCLFICRPLTKRRRESNPGRLGGKRSRFLCAMPSPQSILSYLRLYITFSQKCVKQVPGLGAAPKRCLVVYLQDDPSLNGICQKTILLIKEGGMHSTEVVFALLTQQRPWVRISALLLSAWTVETERTHLVLMQKGFCQCS